MTMKKPAATIHTRISQTLDKEIEALSDKERITKAALFRKALQEYVQDERVMQRLTSLEKMMSILDKKSSSIESNLILLNEQLSELLEGEK